MYFWNFIVDIFSKSRLDFNRIVKAYKKSIGPPRAHLVMIRLSCILFFFPLLLFGCGEKNTKPLTDELDRKLLETAKSSCQIGVDLLEKAGKMIGPGSDGTGHTSYQRRVLYRQLVEQAHNFNRICQNLHSIANRIINCKNMLYSQTGSKLRAESGNVIVENWNTAFLGFEFPSMKKLSRDLDKDLLELITIQKELIRDADKARGSAHKLRAIEDRVAFHLASHKNFMLTKITIYSALVILIALIIFLISRSIRKRH